MSDTTLNATGSESIADTRLHDTKEGSWDPLIKGGPP